MCLFVIIRISGPSTRSPFTSLLLGCFPMDVFLFSGAETVNVAAMSSILLHLSPLCARFVLFFFNDDNVLICPTSLVGSYCSAFYDDHLSIHLIAAVHSISLNTMAFFYVVG